MRGHKRELFNAELFSSGGNLLGWAHFSKNPNKEVELFESFIIPDYRGHGLGTYLFEYAQSLTSSTHVTGRISAHDLIGERDEIVRKFLFKNSHWPVLDHTGFKDARLRIIHIDSL
jgi:hypothetical protein